MGATGTHPLYVCGRLLELDWVVALLDLRIDAPFHKDAVPDHKGQHGPQAAGVIGNAISVLLELSRTSFLLKMSSVWDSLMVSWAQP